MGAKHGKHKTNELEHVFKVESVKGWLNLVS